MNNRPVFPINLLKRRDVLLASAAMAFTGCSTNKRTSQEEFHFRNGELKELDASHADGIDLYIERNSLIIDGKLTTAITVNGAIPGPVLHMKEGEQALIRVHNRLNESTSIHWHGILLPFTMDGVPGISFPGIPAHSTFTYRFPVRQNGTYWYHSHTGMQEQLGLYGMIIISPREEDPVKYDRHIPLVLSDWTFENPETIMRNLKTVEGYYNFQRQTLANIDEQMSAMDESLGTVLKKRLAWQRMRMDPTDIADVTGAAYRFLLNGCSAQDNPLFSAQPGERIRLRCVNASAMTYYDLRIPGIPMTVVQADGQNVKPVEVDELRISVAETYDVLVTLPDTNPYTIFAEAMDRSGYALGTLTGGQRKQTIIPEQRMRPLLTMADMGMINHDMGKQHEAKNDNKHSMHDAGPKINSISDDETNHAAAGHKNSDRQVALPLRNLPEQIMHGTENHGAASITSATMAYRQLDDPGTGLGKDNRRVLTYRQLKALAPPPGRRAPTREFNLHLTGNMHKYIWGFDGKKWSESEMIQFEYGERLRINFINDTMMNHPLHLHGMWMDLYAGHAYDENPRKHTINVQPAELVTVDISADAPGQWAFHCHLLYHMEMGMFRTVAVVRSVSEEPIHVK